MPRIILANKSKFRTNWPNGKLNRVLQRYRINPGAMDIGIYAMYAANRRGSSKVQALVEMLTAALAPITH